MKIISWNVNGLRAVSGKGFFDYVKREDPDVLIIQETKAHPEQLTEAQIAPEGYFYTYHSCSIRKGYSGVATYSKQAPLDENIAIDIQEFDQEGRIIETHFKDFVLFNVYFPNGGDENKRVPYKMRFYDAFFGHCQRLRQEGKSVIVGGDYNTAHHPIDLARPKENVNTTGFLEEERAKLDWIEELGWVDTFRIFNQDGGNYTWWSQRQLARPKNIGWRIDYFWVTDDLRSAVKSAYHQPDVQGSDHCPVVIELA